MVAEKRNRTRRKMEHRCWVAAGPTLSLGECYLCDVSSSGAKLVLGTESQLPKKFDLYLTSDGNVGRNCEVVWQSGKELGVRFLGRVVVPLRTSVGSVEASIVDA